MVEHRPWLTFLTHAILILGIILIAFPIYTTFVASTHSLDEITTSFPLLPGRHLIENYHQALTVGSGEVGSVGVGSGEVGSLGVGSGEMGENGTSARRPA